LFSLKVFPVGVAVTCAVLGITAIFAYFVRKRFEKPVYLIALEDCLENTLCTDEDRESYRSKFEELYTNPALKPPSPIGDESESSGASTTSITIIDH